MKGRQEGDERLLTLLLDERGVFVAAAKDVVKCAALADDVVQDVAERLCRIEGPRPVTNARGYLRRMVRNMAIDVLRRIEREGGEPPAACDVDALAAPCVCPLARVEACQALRAVRAALAAAPPRTRAAFVSHRVSGVPQKAIAAGLGVSPTLVNFMIRDATALCRRALDEADGVQPPRGAGSSVASAAA